MRQHYLLYLRGGIIFHTRAGVRDDRRGPGDAEATRNPLLLAFDLGVLLVRVALAFRAGDLALVSADLRAGDFALASVVVGSFRAVARASDPMNVTVATRTLT